jgi:hypothetical protein
VGQSIVLLSAVAAISNPSMLMMCQKASPRRINLSAQRRPTVVSHGFAQVVDLSDDRIHIPMKHVETTLFLPILVSVGAS